MVAMPVCYVAECPTAGIFRQFFIPMQILQGFARLAYTEAQDKMQNRLSTWWGFLGYREFFVVARYR
jgi:hypothetical protein